MGVKMAEHARKAPASRGAEVGAGAGPFPAGGRKRRSWRSPKAAVFHLLCYILV